MKHIQYIFIQNFDFELFHVAFYLKHENGNYLLTSSINFKAKVCVKDIAFFQFQNKKSLGKINIETDYFSCFLIRQIIELLFFYFLFISYIFFSIYILFYPHCSLYIFNSIFNN